MAGIQHAGTFKCVSTIDPRTGTRSTAALVRLDVFSCIFHLLIIIVQAYLFPALDRPNLKVLTGATVCRLLTTKQTEGVIATGAEFGHGDKVYTVNAGKEVILTAG